MKAILNHAALSIYILKMNVTIRQRIIIFCKNKATCFD